MNNVGMWAGHCCATVCARLFGELSTESAIADEPPTICVSHRFCLDDLSVDYRREYIGVWCGGAQPGILSLLRLSCTFHEALRSMQLLDCAQVYKVAPSTWRFALPERYAGGGA